jgi:hypothetical protein
MVDVKLLLKGLNSSQTGTGQWVHVIGYVTSIQVPSAKAEPSFHMTGIGVQALMLWTAADLDIAAYEKTYDDKLGCE